MDYDYMNSPLFMDFHGLPFVALREKKKIDERKYPWTVQNNPYYMVVYFLVKL